MNELSRRLRVVLYSLFACTVLFMVLPADLSFIQNPFEFYTPFVALILRQIRHDILPANVRLIGFELTAPLQLYLVASFVFGFAVSIPIVGYQIYKFVDPALYPHERRALYPFVISFSLLFLAGAAFGYRILTPFVIWALFPFFSAVQAEQVISIIDFYNMVFVTTLMTGLVFTTPVFFVLLVRFGIMRTSAVTKNRRYIYAALYIATAVVTPDGGPLADFALFLPMIALLEAGVYVAKRYEKPRSAPVSEPPQLIGCKFCGARLPGTSVFCDKCGKSQL